MKTPLTATLLDVLTDGFEGAQGCQESTNGWRKRQLPMPTPETARKKAAELIVEASQWKGGAMMLSSNTEPCRVQGFPTAWVRKDATFLAFKWPDLEIWWADRGILVLVPDPGFDAWWHKPETWGSDPMNAVEAALRDSHHD